tara:strand:- start:3171 stop:3857 length:687 start_codon:yes stop_codon:yes gene_type:complete
MTKDYLYISSLDKYLSLDGQLYSDEDLDLFLTMEKDWRDNQPNYTFYQLMEIFSEATKSARRGVKTKMKHYKKMISQANEKQEQYQQDKINKAHFSEQAQLKKESDEFFDEIKDKYESQIKTCVFQLNHLDILEGKALKKNFNGVDEAQIAEARSVPITSLHTGKLRKSGKRAIGNCPFHKEKTGSFTIYLDQNSFYCYGCNFGGSVIDYVMKQQDIDFLSAVKKLIK